MIYHMMSEMLRHPAGEKLKRRIENPSNVPFQNFQQEISQVESSWSDDCTLDVLNPSGTCSLACDSTVGRGSMHAHHLVAHSKVVEALHPIPNTSGDLKSPPDSVMSLANGFDIETMPVDFECDPAETRNAEVSDATLQIQNIRGNFPASFVPSRGSHSNGHSDEPMGGIWPWENRSSSSQNMASAFAMPMDTYIRIPRFSRLAAWMENARILGVSIEYLIKFQPVDGCVQSLWLSDKHALSGDMIGFLKRSTPDLAPTALQLQNPHYLYLDCMPFPELREKILALRAVEPKILDEDELKRDIDEGEAMRCLGPTPWERKSWEIQPWFLRKWWMVTGGEHGELGQLSRWWRLLRS
jgi:hypothetical protein